MSKISPVTMKCHSLGRIAIFTCLLSLVSNPMLFADPSSEIVKIPPPPPPYLGTLKGNVKFSKIYTYFSAQTAKPDAVAGAAPPEIKELDSILSGEIRKDHEIFVDGSSQDVWRLGPHRFIIYSAHPDYTLAATISLNGYEDDADFKELTWVDANSFQGEQVYQDHKCYFYKTSGLSAWIDETSLLPLYCESGLAKIAFSYEPFDGPPLQLPPDAAKKLIKLKKSWSGQ